MITKYKYLLIVSTIISMLFPVAATHCNGESSQSWGVKAVYTRVVATSVSGDYDLDCDIFIQELPGGKPIRLTDWAKHSSLAPYVGNPKWSQDGTHVLFRASQKGHKVVIPENIWPSYPWILDIHTKELRRIGQTTDRWYREVAWLPNQQGIVASIVLGKKPYFAYNTDSQTEMLMSGGKMRLVKIDNKTGKEKIIKHNYYPDRLLILPYGQKQILYDWDSDRFVLLDLDSGRQRMLMKSISYNLIAISPDGKRFAWYYKGVLRVCNIQTCKVKVLYNARDVYDRGYRLIWSPDSKWIVLRHSVTDITSIDPPVASSTSYLTLVDTSNGKNRLLLEDSIKVPIGWTRDSRNILLKHTEKADGVFPNDSKTVITAFPISATEKPSSIEIVGYLGEIAVQ